MTTRSEERLAELFALLDSWGEAHDEAATRTLQQFARLSGELAALERTMKARHERYRSELAALQYKLETLVGSVIEP